MKNPKPQPVTVDVRCSLCDLEWAKHGDEPTTADCIRLLRAELRVRPTTIPWPVPYVAPYRVWWNDTGSAGGATGFTYTGNSSTTATVTYLTPRSDGGPEPVAA